MTTIGAFVFMGGDGAFHVGSYFQGPAPMQGTEAQGYNGLSFAASAYGYPTAPETRVTSISILPLISF